MNLLNKRYFLFIMKYISTWVKETHRVQLLKSNPFKAWWDQFCDYFFQKNWILEANSGSEFWFDCDAPTYFLPFLNTLSILFQYPCQIVSLNSFSEQNFRNFFHQMCISWSATSIRLIHIRFSSWMSQDDEKRDYGFYFFLRSRSGPAIWRIIFALFVRYFFLISYRIEWKSDIFRKSGEIIMHSV